MLNKLTSYDPLSVLISYSIYRIRTHPFFAPIETLGSSSMNPRNRRNPVMWQQTPSWDIIEGNLKTNSQFKGPLSCLNRIESKERIITLTVCSWSKDDLFPSFFGLSVIDVSRWWTRHCKCRNIGITTQRETGRYDSRLPQILRLFTLVSTLSDVYSSIDPNPTLIRERDLTGQIFLSYNNQIIILVIIMTVVVVNNSWKSK